MVEKESGLLKTEVFHVSDDSSSSSSSSSGDSTMSEELRYKTELTECLKERNQFELELIQLNSAKIELEGQHGEKIRELKLEMLQKEVKNVMQLKTLERERDLARIKCEKLMAEMEKKTKEKPADHCPHCAHCNGFGELEEFIFAEEEDGMLAPSPEMEEFMQNIECEDVRGGRDGDEEMMERAHENVRECRQEETEMGNKADTIREQGEVREDRQERTRDHGEVREGRRGVAEMMERRECHTVRHAEQRHQHFEMNVEESYRDPHQQVRASPIPVLQRPVDYCSNNNLNDVVNVETGGNLVHMEHEEEVVEDSSFAEVKTENVNNFLSARTDMRHGESLRKKSRTKDGYALFRKRKMDQLMGENPKMKPTEARSKISMLWRGLSDKTAAEYSALAETERKKCEEKDRNKRIQVAEIEVITIDDSDDEV